MSRTPSGWPEPQGGESHEQHWQQGQYGQQGGQPQEQQQGHYGQQHWQQGQSGQQAGEQHWQQGQYGQQNWQHGGPQDGPRWGQPVERADLGGSPWQAPSYGATAPPWLSAYGQGGPRTAPRGSRVGAEVLDLFILGIPLMLLIFVPVLAISAAVGPSTGARSTGMTSGDVALFIALLGVWFWPAVAPAIYYGYFDGVRGATPGKRICGLRVVGIHTGAPIGFWRTVLRRLVLGLTSSAFLLGYFSILFDSSGQDRGWHDMVADSRVVQA